MKANWRANFLKNREKANQCNNYGETKEVEYFVVHICAFNDRIGGGKSRTGPLGSGLRVAANRVSLPGVRQYA